MGSLHEFGKVTRLVSTICVVAFGVVGADIRPAAGEGNELEVVTNCLDRDAPALFPGTNSVGSVVIWNSNRTSADVAVSDGNTTFVTYRVVEKDKGLKVSAKSQVETPDATFGERQSRMVRKCMYEAGIDTIAIN